jgi:hypothetical protein
VNPQGGNAIGPNYLTDCLDAIVASDPALVEDHRTRWGASGFVETFGCG